MSNGRAPNLREKLAASLLALAGEAIPRELAKTMSPQQIIHLFEFDHYPVARAFGGSNHPTNLVPLLKQVHRIKTAKIDQPAISKGKRITEAQADFRARLLARDNGEPIKPRGTLRSRPMPCGRASRYRKKFNGKVVERQR